MDAHITITVGGWFDSLPPITKKYVQDMVLRAEKDRGWEVRFSLPGVRQWRR